MTDWFEVAGRLSDEISRSAAAYDRDGGFATDHLEVLVEAGYLTMVLAAPDGTDADLSTVCAAQTVLARGCASTALAVNMHLFAIGSRAESTRAGVDGHQRLLDRAAAGQIVGGTFTDTLTRDGTTPVVARPIASGYVIDGRRPFCSLAPVLDLYFGTARVQDSDRTIAFWLPRTTTGLTFEDTWDTMSMRGSGSWDVVLSKVFVPHLMAGEVGVRGPWDRDAERTLAWFVCTVVAVYLGVAEAAVAFTAERVGARGAAAIAAVEAQRLGDVLVDLNTARALLRDVLTRRTTTLLSEADLAVMKSVATNRCIAAVDGCVDLVGGAALYKRIPLERLYRDVRAARMHPPTDDRARSVVVEEHFAARPLTATTFATTAIESAEGTEQDERRP